MRSDFTGFEKAYAETSNRELLLNLARLENHEPTYFFKLGQITSQYRMQASLTSTTGLTAQGMTPGGAIVTSGGTPGVLYENDPIFQFIPVNDDTNAQLLLKPIPPETFYILYQQGWRLDQLFRLLVDRIEIARPTANGGCKVQTIRNAPPPLYATAGGTPDTTYSQDPYALSSYVTFLRVSAVVYALQKHGMLLLRGKETFVAYDKQAGILDTAGPPKDESGAKGPPQDEEDHGAASQNKSAAPAAKDQNDAIEKNNVWEKQGNSWFLGHKVFVPMFLLNPLKKNPQNELVPDEDAISQEMLKDLPELGHGPALQQALMVLSAGFSIEGDTGAQQATDESLCSASGVSSHLVMRSMIGIMAAAAQEEAPFDSLLKYDPEIPIDTHVQSGQQEAAPLRFSQAVPRIERLPLLHLTWEASEQPQAPVIRVNYRGTDYMIADPATPDMADNQYWNRDMFRLINDLTSQVTVDISKFPLPEILQVHSD